MKILLLSRHGRLGASSRVRSYQYIPYLNQAGIQVTVEPLLDDVYLQSFNAGRSPQWSHVFRAYMKRMIRLLTSSRFDLIWVEYELFPWLPAWFETLLDMAGIPFVVDYDDATFHRYDMHTNRIIRLVLGQKIDSIMRHATVVIAGNGYLAARAHQAGARRVEILPTVVDMDRYDCSPDMDRQVFRIGWIGSPSTTKYLQLIHSALVRVCRQTGAELVLVGAGPIHLEGVSMERREWAESSEVEDIQSFDVGVMPLVDEPWERGKCGYKLIQYMGCCCPVVASPVGVNRDIVHHGSNGFLADCEDEWVRYLSILQGETELRKRMGSVGRTLVEREYSVQVMAPRLAFILTSAVGGAK